MRSSRLLVVFVLAFAVTGVAAGGQLAMLVEVTPRGLVDGGTLTEIVVRVAPEDRAALGEDVMLWVELSREEVRVLRRGWALKIDDPAEPLEVEIVIPNGPHVLRVDLKGAEGRSTGVWWGDVDVSVSSTAAEVAAPTEPTPETVGGAFMPRDPDAEDVRAVNDPPTDSGVLDPVPDPDPDPEDSDSQERQQAATAAGATAATEAETATESDDRGSGQGQLSTAIAVTEPVPAHDPAPGTTGEVSIECFPPPSPSLPGRDELTVMVTRDGAPVPDLAAEQFEVIAGGETIPVSRVEGPGEGLANLRIAIDLDATTLADMNWITGLVERLVEMVHPRPGVNIIGNLAGRFSCPIRFDPASTGSLGWMIDNRKGLQQQDLPRLILSSLDSAKTARGKSFLVVVTDGRGSRNPKAWKGVHEAAAEAGVPVFIVGIWREDFGSGLRKDLRKLAAASGGAAFYVQGPSQVDDLIERFGAEIDGAYSVVVESLEMPGRVVAAVVGIDADVRSAAAIRWSKSRYDFEGDRIRGMFVYFADAANFTECTTGRKFPVAMEADYLAAERAYLEGRSGPWATLMMTIEGRVEIRSHMERGFVNESIIIDRFIAVHPGEECE